MFCCLFSDAFWVRFYFRNLQKKLTWPRKVAVDSFFLKATGEAFNQVPEREKWSNSIWSISAVVKSLIEILDLLSWVESIFGSVSECEIVAELFLFFWEAVVFLCFFSLVSFHRIPRNVLGHSRHDVLSAPLIWKLVISRLFAGIAWRGQSLFTCWWFGTFFYFAIYWE